jgi:hypothetical protein
MIVNTKYVSKKHRADFIKWLRGLENFVKETIDKIEKGEDGALLVDNEFGQREVTKEHDAVRNFEIAGRKITIGWNYINDG